MSAYLERWEANQRIRKALKALTGRDWSVKGGRGTAWAWLRVMSPPRRQIADFDPRGETPERPKPHGQTWGYISREDRAVLAEAWGREDVHPQGIQVSPDEWEAVIARLEERAAQAAGGAS